MTDGAQAVSPACCRSRHINKERSLGMIPYSIPDKFPGPRVCCSEQETLPDTGCLTKPSLTIRFPLLFAPCLSFPARCPPPCLSCTILNMRRNITRETAATETGDEAHSRWWSSQPLTSLMEQSGSGRLQMWTSTRLHPSRHNPGGGRTAEWSFVFFSSFSILDREQQRERITGEPVPKEYSLCSWQLHSSWPVVEGLGAKWRCETTDIKLGGGGGGGRRQGSDGLIKSGAKEDTEVSVGGQTPSLSLCPGESSHVDVLGDTAQGEVELRVRDVFEEEDDEEDEECDRNQLQHHLKPLEHAEDMFQVSTKHAQKMQQISDASVTCRTQCSPGVADKYFFVDVRDETILHRDRVSISRMS
ncbi:unnamed protein product [Pleuronectes platessa]|uniref:Uncharacterized protein n=1 Tax=Pleuronectes platessa TaxID=8262 RepID=A0A9N7YVE6_PLEPL|nr:unnamed protein product [Pleuronectes platessa]